MTMLRLGKILPADNSSNEENVGTDVGESTEDSEEYSDDDYGLVDDEDKNFDETPENERE